jgi:hypothetical protein
MANTIKLRRSATQGAVPTTSQLALGELAMNTYDGKLFVKTDQSGTEAIVEIGASGGGTGTAKKFDDISSSFNGTLTTFNITVNSTAHYPVDINATIISIGGVTQEPTTSYTISGSTITFTSPPASGLDFYGVDLGVPVAIGTPDDGTVTPVKLSTGGPSWNTYGVLESSVFQNDQNLTADLTVAANKNAAVFGPVYTIAGGVTLTVSSGSVFSVA